MKTTDYLDRLAVIFSTSTRPASDYAIAKRLGIPRQSMTRYRKGGTFDDAVALRVAKALKIDPAPMLADIQAERAKDDEVRQVWERIARQFTRRAGRAALFLLAAGTPLSLLVRTTEYILCQIAVGLAYVKFNVQRTAVRAQGCRPCPI